MKLKLGQVRGLEEEGGLRGSRETPLPQLLGMSPDPNDPFMWCGSMPPMPPIGPSEPGPIGKLDRLPPGGTGLIIV